MFTIRGTIAGQEESITYALADGKGSVQGGPMAMFLLKNAMERQTPTGPVGQPLDRDMDDPLAALFMIMECFDTVTDWEGDLPTADELPDGAIG